MCNQDIIKLFIGEGSPIIGEVSGDELRFTLMVVAPWCPKNPRQIEYGVKLTALRSSYPATEGPPSEEQ